jgi:hypothetical protein
VPASDLFYYRFDMAVKQIVQRVTAFVHKGPRCMVKQVVVVKQILQHGVRTAMALAPVRARALEPFPQAVREHSDFVALAFCVPRGRCCNPLGMVLGSI